MIDNSISILGQVISIILGMFSTYIVLNFHNFKEMYSIRNMYIS